MRVGTVSNCFFPTKEAECEIIMEEDSALVTAKEELRENLYFQELRGRSLVSPDCERVCKF